MPEKGESLMGQDRGCRQGDPISPIPGDECVLLWPLLCGVLHYRSRTKPLETYCHSCSLVISVRTFGTHPHLFPALKSALSGCHFRSNEEVQQAVKNFPRSLGHRFLPGWFLEIDFTIRRMYQLKNSQKFVFCYVIVCFGLLSSFLVKKHDETYFWNAPRRSLSWLVLDV
ncbi:hypothetical protein AVEN_91701-1 [Araneus ventricosus]|uniref:Uncharacterized protein n=1 Tax=Araneus ventricosus TaxID=182803 RepID=A0A4Y2HH80_ARAVE|nr:hypothetical protein AVEN_91701-1 [Araneus ventricosus]